MPLLIKVTGALAYMVSVHNVENFVADALSIAAAFTNKAKRQTQHVIRIEEYRAGRRVVSTFLVLAN